MGGQHPFVGGELGPHLTQCGQGRGLPSCQFIFIHQTIWPQYTNVTDRTDRTVTQKRFALCYQTVICPVCLFCGQTVGWIKMKLRMQLSLGPATLLDGDQAPPPPKAHSPQFSAHICCGQMAGWFKMPRGTEVDLGPGDSSMWRQSSPSQKGGTAPNFRLMTSVAKRLYQDTTWYGGSLSLTTLLDGDPAPPPLKGHSPHPNFRPMSIVAKRLDGLRCNLVWR